jgi:hypothetical protein
MDGAVADMAIGQPGELEGLVDDGPVDVEERDLLEGDDVGVQLADDAADPIEPLVRDVAPPRRRERLARSDRGPDVPGRDADRRGPYLTEPASRPWTK